MADATQKSVQFDKFKDAAIDAECDEDAWERNLREITKQKIKDFTEINWR